MENNRFVKTLILLLLFLFPLFGVFSYDDKTTHPALTDEIVDFYNLSFDFQIDDDFKEQIVQGSIDEDFAPRYFNHFYDPIYNVGWQGYRSSKKWAKYNVQEYSWDKVIGYYAEGNKEKAYYALGHILHLIEDSSVPEHTRDDTHVGHGVLGSPYENWTEKFNRDNLDLAEKFFQNGEKVLSLNFLDEYFDFIANYSNNNFFSEGTIFYDKYLSPVEFKREGNYGYGIDSLGSGLFKLFKQEKSYSSKNIKPPTLRDDLIMFDYWSLLSKQVVLTGAGVIDLFHQEAEIALVERLQQEGERTAFQNLIDATANYFSIVLEFTASNLANATNMTSTAIINSYYYIINPTQKSIEKAFSQIDPKTQVAGNLPLALTPDPENVQSSALNNETDLSGLQDKLDQAKVMVEALESKMAVIENVRDQATKKSPAQTLSSQQVGEFSLVLALKTSTASLPAYQIYTISSPGFGGGAPPPTSSPAPTPELAEEEIIVEDDDSTLDAEEDSGGESESEPETEELVDTTPPDITLSMSGCESSISIDVCLLISTTTVDFLWSSTADDFDYFLIDQNNSFATTTATSATVEILNDSIYLFGVSAVDTTGNQSATSTKQIAISSMPVVINEVAWMGTALSSADEWIELYNRSNQEINLDSWTLMAEDKVPYIKLSGTILPNDFYLIERSDDQTVSDIEADLIVPFSGLGRGSGLENTGESLELLYNNGTATTTIDKTVTILSGRWPAGDNRLSMEKYDPSLSGLDESSWGRNLGLVRNGKDGGGDSINGTPKARNSINYLINRARPISGEDVTLYENNSYIILNLTQKIEDGATLHIEPGVIIKFYKDGGLSVSDGGSIKSLGTADSPIVFTSIYDDEYGGDSSNDATSTRPRAGDWRGIEILSEGSVFENTIFRYGGKAVTDNQAILLLRDSSAIIKDSTFENSGSSGIRLINSTSTISGSTFLSNSNSGVARSSGIYVERGGAPEIRSSTFKNNRSGLYIQYSNPVIEDNIFEDNEYYAIFVAASPGIISGNSGSGNGFNGIYMLGDIAVKNATTTLKLNFIPYILGTNPRVAASSTLIIDPGVVIKGLYSHRIGATGLLFVDGVLKINGTNPSDIIFTSLTDDSVGGDSKNDGDTNTGRSRQWRGIKINEGGILNGTGFSIRYADTALTVSTSATTTLKNVSFGYNTIGVKGEGGGPFIANNINFISGTSTTATTTPAGLW